MSAVVQGKVPIENVGDVESADGSIGGDEASGGASSDRFTNRISVRLIEHATKLDLASFEDPVFYDRLERARVQATDRLAMKGDAFMEGKLNLKTKLEIPPLDGKVIHKLRLDGRFDVTDAHFLKSTVQDQIDSLSRRGQGQPKNQGIDEVISRMTGSFQLDSSVITFRDLTFGVPGADVQLEGNYDLNADALDFHGALRLKAKVSQTVTGWKHWLLKPVDPFLSKNGAGTYLKIQVVGNSKAPKFGLDR